MIVLCVSSGTMPEANFVVTLLVDLINHLLGYVVEENVNACMIFKSVVLITIILKVGTSQSLHHELARGV